MKLILHIFKKDLPLIHKLLISLMQYLDYFLIFIFEYTFYILRIPFIWLSNMVFYFPKFSNVRNSVRRLEGLFCFLYITIFKVNKND